MKLMSESNLATLLEAYKGASFVSCVTATEPKLNARHRETREPNPYLGRVKRMAVRAGMIGANYENAVNNRRLQEDHVGAGQFDAHSLWNGAGEHVSPCLVRHKNTNRLYMVFYPKHDQDGDVQVSDSQWMLDGQTVPHTLIQPYLPPHKEGSERQETARAVPWRVIGLDNIVSITIHGETYTVTH